MSGTTLRLKTKPKPVSGTRVVVKKKRTIEAPKPDYTPEQIARFEENERNRLIKKRAKAHLRQSKTWKNMELMGKSFRQDALSSAPEELHKKIMKFIRERARFSKTYNEKKIVGATRYNWDYEPEGVVDEWEARVNKRNRTVKNFGQ